MEEQRSPFFGISDVWIIIAGLATTALTLLGVFLLSNADKDFEIMGWYALFIIPAGAILVGIASGSGYGLVSWITGRKINGKLLAMILVLLVVSYAAAQYVQFKSLHLVYTDGGQSVGFWEYYDFTTRNMVFSLHQSKTSSGPLGVLGYLFRVLELAGFAVGGLLIPIGLKTKPYCDRCNVYMRKLRNWWLPAGILPRKFGKKETEAQEIYEKEMNEAFEKGMELSRELIEAAKERNIAVFQQVLEKAMIPKEAVKLMHRIEVHLSTCKKCSDGILVVSLVSGHGDKIKTQKLATQPVESGFVQSISPQLLSR